MTYNVAVREYIRTEMSSNDDSKDDEYIFDMDFSEKGNAESEMYSLAARKFLEMQEQTVEKFSYVEMLRFGNGVKVVGRIEYANGAFFQRVMQIELTEGE